MLTKNAVEEEAAARAIDPGDGVLLLISGSAHSGRLPSGFEGSGAGAFRVEVADGLDAARERLGNCEFDAVVLDLDGLGGAAVEGVLEMAGTMALVVVGGDPDQHPTVADDAAEWITSDASASAIAGRIRGAVERRRLRDDLEGRTAQLAESEARFRNIIDSTPDGIVIVDRTGRVRFANPGAQRMFERSSAELVDQDFGVAVVSGETTEMDIVASAGRQSAVAELRVSGTRWEGSPAQIISLRDITDRKLAEEKSHRLAVEQAGREQAENEAARSRFLADAGDALDASLNAERTLASLAGMIVPRVADWCLIDVIERDRVRRIASVHEDAQKQELLARLAEAFLPGPESPQFQGGEPLLQRGLDGKSIRDLSMDAVHADLLAKLGTRSIMTVPLEAREKILGSITFVSAGSDYDETDLALALEIGSRAARALDNARLFESALLANRTKSDFLAVMSHELRTPLTAILGYTDLMIEGVAGEMTEKQGGYLQRTRAGAAQLLDIIQEILTYADMEAGRAQVRPRAVAIGELIDEVVAMAAPPMREKGLEFRLEMKERDATLFTDAGKLRQIVLNLLTNALKFTETGTVGLSVELCGDVLEIVVSDTGIGISASELEAIFEPFRQVEQGRTRRAGGTGLGLSVSRQLAELVGGELTVESNVGTGSSFTLRVPVGTAPTD